MFLLFLLFLELPVLFIGFTCVCVLLYSSLNCVVVSYHFCDHHKTSCYAVDYICSFLFSHHIPLREHVFHTREQYLKDRTSNMID